MGSLRKKALLVTAAVVVVAAGSLYALSERQDREMKRYLEAFSRAYLRCTDRVDAEYQAKIKKEFRSSVPVFEQPDYDDFIQRRVDCAKPR